MVKNHQEKKEKNWKLFLVLVISRLAFSLDTNRLAALPFLHLRLDCFLVRLPTWKWLMLTRSFFSSLSTYSCIFLPCYGFFLVQNCQVCLNGSKFVWWVGWCRLVFAVSDRRPHAMNKQRWRLKNLTRQCRLRTIVVINFSPFFFLSVKFFFYFYYLLLFYYVHLFGAYYFHYPAACLDVSPERCHYK